MKSINRTFIIAGGLALSGVIIAGLAMASQSGHFGHHKHHKSFSAKSLDTDGDGMLARDELLAKNQRRFSKLDTDGDGSISPEEFSARLAKMFDRLDVNANGLLEPGEMPRRVNTMMGAAIIRIISIAIIVIQQPSTQLSLNGRPAAHLRRITVWGCLRS